MSKDNTTSKSFYDKYQVLIHAVLILFAAGVICWLSVLFMDFWTHHGKTKVVPDVVGKDYIEAINILQDEDFEVEIDSIYDREAKYGQVLAQSPSQNEVVKYGRTIYLKINSTHPEIVEFTEEFLHISSMHARNMLEALGFSNIKIKEIIGNNDDEVIEVKSNGSPVGIGTRLPVTAEIVLTVTYAPNESMYIDTLSVDRANMLLGDTLSID